MTFSEKLLLLRKQKRLSQEQLAEMLDVSRQSVSKWESQQTLPEPSKLILISQIFNVSIDQLLKDDMPMEGDEERTAANAEAAEPGARRCQAGYDVLHAIAQCGRENRADSAFCGYCGHPFVSFVADKPESGELTKTDMDLAYYKANLQMQQRALQLPGAGAGRSPAADRAAAPTAPPPAQAV